jgi:hypothetical protein
MEDKNNNHSYQYIQVKFHWNNEYWICQFNFNNVTIDEFQRTAFDLSFIEEFKEFTSSRNSITGCKKIKHILEEDFLNAFTKGVTDPIEHFNDLLMALSFVRFFTVMRSNSKWKILSTIVENPEFQCQGYTMINDGKILGRTLFCELYKVKPDVYSICDSFKNIDVFMHWKNDKLHIPINSIDYQLFHIRVSTDVIKKINFYIKDKNNKNNTNNKNNKNNKKNTTTDSVFEAQKEFCEVHNKAVDTFIDIYKSQGKYSIDMLIVFGYVYFCSNYIRSKHEWFSLKEFTYPCSIIYRERTYCSFCQKPSDENRKKCSGCKSTKVFYCSSDCQKQHWPEHKKQCQNSKPNSSQLNEVD